MRTVFLGALCAAMALSGRADANDWSGKFVFAYTALYENHRDNVKSVAVVEFSHDSTIANESDCHGAAFRRAKLVAARRNPRAKLITWDGGWVGRCWTGEKPEEPVAWSSFARGTQW
jgi:hypothetical protein